MTITNPTHTPVIIHHFISTVSVRSGWIIVTIKLIDELFVNWKTHTSNRAKRRRPLTSRDLLSFSHVRFILHTTCRKLNHLKINRWTFSQQNGFKYDVSKRRQHSTYLLSGRHKQFINNKHVRRNERIWWLMDLILLKSIDLIVGRIINSTDSKIKKWIEFF